MNILAHEALQRGLVNHVYPQAELQDEGIKLAIKIRNNSRHAVQLSKELIQRGQDLDLDTANVMESGMFGLSFATPDQEEGMNAFLQRRKPDFLYS